MSLGVLNNLSAINAQNNLSQTQAALSKTLQQLSSGSRINSGADDAAGLSLANGLQASATALSQSAKNASEGVDFLQVADGALAQVTSLLNRAVTLATESSNGTLNSSQTAAADSEYQKILTEISTINNNTEYNGISTFAKNTAYAVGSASDHIDVGAGGAGSFQITVGSGASKQTLNVYGSTNAGAAVAGYIAPGGTGAYKISGADTLNTVVADINAQFGASVATVQAGQLILTNGATMTAGAGALYETHDVNTAPVTTLTVANAADILTPGGLTTANELQITPKGGVATDISVATGAWDGGGAGGNLFDLAGAINSKFGASGVTASVSGNTMTITGGTLSQKGAAKLTETDAANPSTNSTVAIFTSDGTISQSYNNNALDLVKADSSSLSLTGTFLTSSASAQSALAAINVAITTVAADRGTLGANINTLTAVSNVMTTQSTNTLAAQNDVTATDYGQATSDMSKYQILSQTGIAALAQANQSQQLIAKLLQ